MPPTSELTPDRPPLLSLDGLTKRFPGVTANDHVSLKVGRGEIHALLGENGAGKSTLVKMIYGYLRPDEGSMYLDGAAYAPANPAEARARGVGIVFQHFSLFEAMTVAENIALGLPAAQAGRELSARIIRVSQTYGLKLDPARLVGTLSVGERQRVEIVRCLLQSPSLIIMDEPTSVLTPQETLSLFVTLRRLAAEGCAILYISHKLDEVRSLCTTATVLRDGRVAGSCDPRRETARDLAAMMIGRTLPAPLPRSSMTGRVRLEVDALTMPQEEHFGVGLVDISFDVAAGEILGIAGVAGNGQSELMSALTGERPVQPPGAITFDGRPIGCLPPDQRRAAGMAFVPEERLGHAAVPDLSLADNMLLAAASTPGLVKNGIIDRAACTAAADAIVAAFGVRTTGVEHAAHSLSGGNLQKFIVGREIIHEPSVLVVAQPTWGVDAGASAAIHQALRHLTAGGCAVVVISQDLDELFTLADRIAVIANGRLTPPAGIATLTIESIGRAMGGDMGAREAVLDA